MSERHGQDVVLFGGTGDLVMRKLLPALYHLHCDGMLGADVAIIGKRANATTNNRLVITMQPDESVKLHLQAKRPGDAMTLNPVSLDLDFAESFQTRRLEAYERLLMDVMRGNLTLFVRRDEQEAAWRWVEPILASWAASSEPPKPYTAGTWGPAASTALLGREGFHWHEEL
jgi:glucose-6-phosphate 1-dehydrogenase